MWAYRRADPTAALASIDRMLFHEVNVVDYDRDCANEFGRVRIQLRRQGIEVPTVDLMILVQVGRAIDFISPAASDPQRDYFWRLHSLYSSSEVGKEILGLILAVILIRKSRQSESKSQSVESFSAPVGHTR